jgi:hypothetical protein
MVIYQVFDAVKQDRRVYRNKSEASKAFSAIQAGKLEQIDIKYPITKDAVIALLNREGYEESRETIREK